MCTVNGILTVDEGLQLQVPALNRKVEFALADDSPPILSVGKRCMQDGYSFFWPRGKDPYLVDQYNNIIKLTVENFVPYIAHSTDGAATGGVERGTSSDDPKGSTVPGFKICCQVNLMTMKRRLWSQVSLASSFPEGRNSSGRKLSQLGI